MVLSLLIGQYVYGTDKQKIKLQPSDIGDDVGSSSLTGDRTPGSLHWEHGVLATGPPEKSWLVCKFLKLVYCSKSFYGSTSLNCGINLGLALLTD